MLKMNTIFLSVLSILLIVQFSLAQDFSGLSLIAHYPLDSDSSDATGNNPPIYLSNVTFKDGGVYCNGIYAGNSPDGSEVRTPDLKDLDFKKFAIQLRFKVDEYLYQPVFIGGVIWRWTGLYLKTDSTLEALHNDRSFSLNPQIHYKLNVFHTIAVYYDSLQGLAKWYLDGALIDSVAFEIYHGNDPTITIAHGGEGMTFKGVFDDLRVYSIKKTSTGLFADKGKEPERFTLAQNYPNPFNPSTTIEYAVAKQCHVQLKVYNVLGNLVATLVDDERQPGIYRLKFNADELPSGVYFYKIQMMDFQAVRKMIIME